MIIYTISCEKHWTNTHEHVHVHVAGRADPAWCSQAAGIVNSKVRPCCSLLRYRNEALRNDPSPPASRTHNPLLVHRLHLCDDVTGLQHDQRNKPFTHKCKSNQKENNVFLLTICIQLVHHIWQPQTFSVSSSSLSAVKSNLATPFTAECSIWIGWP